MATQNSRSVGQTPLPLGLPRLLHPAIDACHHPLSANPQPLSPNCHPLTANPYVFNIFAANSRVYSKMRINTPPTD